MLVGVSAPEMIRLSPLFNVSDILIVQQELTAEISERLRDRITGFHTIHM